MPPDPDAHLLARQQATFAAWLRDPLAAPAPPADAGRLRVYRTLFFQNVCQLLGSTFPVLRNLLGERGWNAMVDDFYREHRSHTPLFPQLPREFLDWLATRPAQPPFLHELAHYEWVELALALEEIDPSRMAADPDGDLLDGVPVASPLAWPLAYRFAVHRIGPEHVPHAPPHQPTFLLVRRDAQDTLHFHELDALAHALLLAVADNIEGNTGRALIDRLIAGQGAPDTAATLRAAAVERLHALRQRDALLGTRPA